ncbi:MAG: hypothetical protein FWC20_02375 [Oscillospiraceae bacterium]|nr:hypothetical protein [Oscillospiraceae bacterium]MCL2278239.1 hypothetical protein [Oscillospiraceae bacterium]
MPRYNTVSLINMLRERTALERETLLRLISPSKIDHNPLTLILQNTC